MDVLRIGIVLFLSSVGRIMAEDGDVIGPSESHYYDVAGGDTSEGRPVKERLNSIVLPAFECERRDLADVLKDLTVKSKALDPTHVGISFVLDLSKASSATKDRVRHGVILKLSNTSLAEILAYICNQTWLGYRIMGHSVVLRPEF